MLASLPPLLLRPHYVAKPWGGRRLERDLARGDLPPGSIGESWEVFDLGGDDDAPCCSIVEGGPHDGRPLRAVLGHRFPLLLKVIDAREDLSVQVHPDGVHAFPPKEEAWVGLGRDGRVALARAGSVLVEDPAAPPPAGTWLPRLERVEIAGPPAQPDMVHVPPGSVHAILAGSLLFEAQNPVDLTYRLDDHGRRDAEGRARELHLAQAADMLTAPSPARAAPAPGGRDLAGARFSLRLVGPGEGFAQHAQAVFFTAVGEIEHGAAEPFRVPAGRTVVLPPTADVLRSDGWIIAAAAL